MGKKRLIQTTSQEELLKEQEKIEKKQKEEERKVSLGRIERGKIYVYSSYNNTIITLTDLRGRVLTWKSAGSLGFKGTKKGTSFAASKVAESIVNICKKKGIEKFEVLVQGIGAGRDAALRTFAAQGLDLEAIKDITPIPHNGCRPKKPRRV